MRRSLWDPKRFTASVTRKFVGYYNKSYQSQKVFAGPHTVMLSV